MSDIVIFDKATDNKLSLICPIFFIFRKFILKIIQSSNIAEKLASVLS